MVYFVVRPIFTLILVSQFNPLFYIINHCLILEIHLKFILNVYFCNDRWNNWNEKNHMIYMFFSYYFSCFMYLHNLHGHYTRDKYKDPTFICIYIFRRYLTRSSWGAKHYYHENQNVIHTLPCFVPTSYWIIEPSFFIWLHFSNFNSKLVLLFQLEFGLCGLANVRNALGMEWKSFMLGGWSFH